MNKSRIPTEVLVRFIWYGLAFGLPLLFMLNCSGWDTGSMHVDSCLIDLPGLREISNNLWGLLFASVFLLCIPFILYLAVIAAIIEIPLFIIKKRKMV
jgi:hypothetical protein